MIINQPDRASACGFAFIRYFLAIASSVLLQLPAHAEIPDCRAGGYYWKQAVTTVRAFKGAEPDLAKDEDTITGYCYGLKAPYSSADGSADGEKVFAMATELLQRGIARNDALAMHTYAMVYFDYKIKGRWNSKMGGFDRPTPSEQKQATSFANDLFERAAATGFASSLYQLCIRTQDAQQALANCQKAEALGHPGATAQLSTIYGRGLGVPVDAAKAREYVRLAAERGDANALIGIAGAYEFGVDVPRDIAKAAEYYRRAGHIKKAEQLEAAQAQAGETDVSVKKAEQPEAAQAQAGNTDVSVFGLSVGFPMPGIEPCEIPGQTNRTSDAKLCVDHDTTKMDRAMDQLGLTTSYDFASIALSSIAIQVNDEKMDTGILYSIFGSSAPITIAIDKTKIIHFFMMRTKVTAREQVTQVLTKKYGKPTRISWTEWKNTQTGDVVRRTQNMHWQLKGLRVDYYSQIAGALTNSQIPMGRVDVYTPQFQAMLAASQRNTAATSQKGKF